MMAVHECERSILNEVFQAAELRVGCSVCATKKEEITYSINTTPHRCHENFLIAKLKSVGKCWRPISARPKYPHPMRYDVCWFFVEGSGCTVHGKRCTFARSREEALIWDFLKRHFLDLESLISLLREMEQTVSNLEGVSEKILADWCGEFQEVCRECFYGSPHRITEREYSYVCDTDLGHRWRPMMVHSLALSPGNCVFMEIRPLPPNASLQLCCQDTKDKSTGHSPLGCQFAHSKVELAVWKQEVNSEWNRRELLWLSLKRKQPQYTNEGQGPATTLNTSNDSNDIGVPEPVENEMSYQDLLLKEYRGSGKAIVIRLLSHVALLKNEPGAKFNLGDGSKTCTYSVGKTFVKSGLCYEVPVTFTSCLPGLYEQWLVFDFDIRPVLLQKLKVRVGQSISKPEEVLETVVPILERWHNGNRVIIPYFPHLLSKTQDDLLKTYELPQKIFGVGKATDNAKTAICRQNYKERMHHFLFKEEFVEAEIVSRLDFQETMTLSNNLRSPYKVTDLHVHPGELFGILPFSCTLTPNTPEDVLLKRQVESVLVGEVTSNDQSQKVYEAVILRNTDSVKEIQLRLSRDCCYELGLQKGQTRKMEVQFQLNRLQFCEMHKAIDLLPDLDKVLPDFTNSCVPSHSTKYPDLNANQQTAMEFILGAADGQNSVAPLLIYGPFGTGKTFTLATAAKEVVCQSGGRVLICTHTNSSADIYVSHHFNKYFKDRCHKVKPLRIKANKGGKAVKNTDKITLKYCLLSRDGQSFMFPTRSDLDSHHIVIITTSWAKHLHNMSLPKDYFSHIMIDEASQMLECEALMALGLAGPMTRVVLAGDHMQMGPTLFSVEDHKHSDHTLLNRLFNCYQSERKNAASKSRIIFYENYRSNKKIVNFVSTHFYTGKRDSIRACGNVLAHPKHYPLRFHHVRGECHLHPKSQSWYNLEEVDRVVSIVRELFDDWPANVWEPQKAEDICILSAGHQLQVMRKELKKQHLTGVSVQSLLNVQGKQFRVIVMTTVQTRDQLLLSSTSCPEFFNDARVLNTAMTRAQSEVIAVGDAAALCFFGKCAKIWKCYIELCIKKGSIQPDHLTEEFLKKEVDEISRFHKPESDVEVEDTPLIEEDQMDQILEEMINDYAAENSEQSDTESETESNCSSYPRRSSRHPSAHRQGALALQTLSIGSIIRPLKASEFGKSVGIVGQSFVCVLEDDFQQRRRSQNSGHVQKMMVPINKGGTKICVFRQKNRHNFLPIWKLESGVWSITDYKHIDEHLRQRHVFIVQVICWKDHCSFPLGNVTDVYPVGTTIDEGLRILDAKFKLEQLPDSNDIAVEMNDEDMKDLEEIKTFTIDSYDASHLDDAISVSDLGSHYEVGIHITDVASFLRKGDALDKLAEERGATYYRPECKKKPIFMFPESVTTDQWSLVKKEVRRVISLICKVDKTTGSVVKRWQLSRIKSNWKLSYEEVEGILSNSDTLKILLSNKSAKDLTFTTKADFIALAYYFSQTQRKERLPKDWSYSQPRKHQTPGRRRSHLMVEELNILFNHEMSRHLIKEDETKFCTPLRCQKPPSKKKISELKERHTDLVPMSAHLKHHLGCDKQDLEDRPFTVLSSVWNDIQEAAQSGQYDMMADLIGTDDLYPQLLPVISAFRDVQNKAYIICSNSCDEANVGHYSLAVDSYSNATSPLRRYMDIVLQRLFHAVRSHSCVQYSQSDIHKLCAHFKKINQNVEEYEKQAETISLSVGLRKQSASKFACIVSVKPEEDRFIVSFPFNKGHLPEKLSVLYRDLLLDDQPKFDMEKKHVELKWRRQVYTLHTPNVQAKLRELTEGNTCINISQKTWHEIVLAIQKEDWTLATTLISECKTSRVEKHITEALVFKQGDIIQVQLTGVLHNGFWGPRAQLLYIDTNFVVCMEHAQRPMDCFAKQAEYYTKNFYDDIEEYVKIWMPLCQMVSASTAVVDSDRITIENIPIIWKRMKRGDLTGSFSLPIQCIKEWKIEFSMAHCYLCIKKKNLKMQLDKRQEDDVGDPCTFTWVAHGWATSCEETGKKSKNPSKIVKFYINHRSMEQVPEDVCKTDAVFSIELIPKLSPDIWTENAINNTVKANDLVKKIALGWQIKTDASAHILKYNIVRNMRPDGLPELNESQYSAVQQAINNSFTLIQGPPGSGKTIVGAYIVYWFSKYFNQETEGKKEVVLYCGPSNKSVDVVAEYLLRFKDSLKPLRVYSRQIESQDFPLPGNTLQLSQKSRQEESSPQLRSITLHHRIRGNDNPFSQDIKTFDEKIQRQGEKVGEEKEIEEKEIENYKELLIKAREYELKRHDLILCTCTTASSANLTKAISAKMILIDECAMATEPQALVPLVSYNPQKIVLLGDHKQLRPIVRNERAKKMGMSRSLFERCITSQTYEEAACSLNIQYRMHADICEFPSKDYYGGKLKTVANCGECLLQIKRPGLTKRTRIAFVDIRGKEIIQIVSTKSGNERSVANTEESIEAIKIAEALVSKGEVNQEDIAILSPYNAQVSDIKGRLLVEGLANITVCTITKSQGSEWRYVIISVVRSCSSEEIKADNTREWRAKNIGFVGDANQINVGITRAKDGLCILGNQQLLDRSLAWQKLLKFYAKNNCVVNEVSVREVNNLN